VEGFPAHVPVDEEFVNRMLARRQGGYGRSKRQRLEKDRAQFVAGVWKGETTGAPIGILIRNRAAKEQDTVRPRTIPRPGHADLAGAWKYGWEHDLNPVMERASARETAMRVAIGSLCQLLLKELGMEVLGYVRQIGSAQADIPVLPISELRRQTEASDFFCPVAEMDAMLRAEVDRAREEGDSLGGVVEVVAEGVPPGLGGFLHPEQRLDAQIGQALLSIPSVKAVEIGDGIRISGQKGSDVHDAIVCVENRLQRPSNRAGGMEGGISTGERIVVRAFLKPIPTLIRSLASVDLASGDPVRAPYIRSDVVVVPAASVVAEAVVSFVLARMVLQKFGHDHLEDIRFALKNYLSRLKSGPGQDHENGS
jgi:chorismate synthase